MLGGDLVGSVLSGQSSRSSSVIMAYWPGSGADLSTIDYSRKRVGIIQFFFQNAVQLLNKQTWIKSKIEHIFAYAYWKQKHVKEDWFGISGTVCKNTFESLSMSNFLPVEHIANKCAHCVTDIDFDQIRETVFIACPLPFKTCL